MATSITMQMIARAFTSPLGDWITSYSSALNLFTGFILAKKEPGLESTLSVLVSLNTSSRNGLSSAREMTDKSDDKILKLK